MQPVFTGNSRRPRQVNLSGRNQNPFAKYGAPSGSSSTVANAQQTRLERQQERARIQAATQLQRTWRGHDVRRKFRQEQRYEWDSVEERAGSMSKNGFTTYQDEEQARDHLTKLLRFINVQDEKDRKRLQRTFARIVKTSEQNPRACAQGPWPLVYLRLQKTCLAGLQRLSHPEPLQLFQNILVYTTKVAPEWTASNADTFYTSMRHATLSNSKPSVELLVAPLQHLGACTEAAYGAFACKILSIPDLSNLLKAQDSAKVASLNFANQINCRLLTTSLNNLIHRKGGVEGLFARQKHHRSDDNNSLQTAWLTGHLIWLHRLVLGYDRPDRFTAEPTFVSVVCALIAAIIEHPNQDDMSIGDASESASLLDGRGVPPFVLQQIDSLVDQKAIASLINRINVDGAKSNHGSPQRVRDGGDSTRNLANYVLTLLRLYPNRADEIRMWLYVGASNDYDQSHTQGSQAVKIFWKAALDTNVFHKILDDPRAAVGLLRCTRPDVVRENRRTSSPQANEQDWQIILLFIQMYSFILKVMDDEEFFAYDTFNEYRSESGNIRRRNSLREDEIMTLITFLKHLGFTMYYNAAEITRTTNSETLQDMKDLFPSTSHGQTQLHATGDDDAKPTASGLDLEYVKGAVTGLLRAIYERDSRRPFTPKGHWLMTARFDMTGFIDHVVEEEERRHQVQELDEDADGDDEDNTWDSPQSPGFVGTGHVQRLRKQHDLERQRRKESKRRYLQVVAPKLEILQNMPFLIPFTTRVQIFRRFVYHDQFKRRNGTTDPEMWRLSQMHGFSAHNLEKHHATVRRGHEFSDAFDQFYDIGASLKEPIHISFLDKFGQEEAGIDGGGVTKEFLTSVTNEAFNDQEGVRLFSENDQHLLFPNPSALEEQEELLKNHHYSPKSPEFRKAMTHMLKRYEFLGRIIGKCLYEGILIDVGFAGFFLLKWALTGGSGTAAKESGFRANLNDLRDFDEELYQGLLKLKNYPGDVEDFALNFTVADTLRVPLKNGTIREKVVTHELRLGGNDIPVTNANRLVYISYMTRHRLTSQPAFQTNAFLKGLGTMISPSWLSMFNQQELQILVGGAASAINIADLRANTSYGGVYTIGDDGQEHPSVQLFWEVMQSLSDDDRRKVLKFITSTPRAPLLGFSSLNPRFSIRDSGGDVTRLPSTSTCVNLLKLPRYQSFETCRSKLLQAVNSGAGFDLS